MSTRYFNFLFSSACVFPSFVHAQGPPGPEGEQGPVGEPGIKVRQNPVKPDMKQQTEMQIEMEQMIETLD